VSNAGLVLDLDGAERGEQLLDEVVLLVVQRRAAEAGEPAGAPDLLSVDLPLPARSPDAACTSVPSYVQLRGSYERCSASKPENRPSRSSVSVKSSLMIVAALV
jgi:hypothetical protein